MVKDKNLWQAMEEFFLENNLDLSYVEYYKAWPVISGIRLSSSTKLTSLRDLDKKKIYITPSSTSVKALIKLEESNIIKRWNNMFPHKKIEKIVVLPPRV